MPQTQQPASCLTPTPARARPSQQASLLPFEDPSAPLDFGVDLSQLLLPESGPGQGGGGAAAVPSAAAAPPTPWLPSPFSCPAPAAPTGQPSAAGPTTSASSTSLGLRGGGAPTTSGGEGERLLAVAELAFWAACECLLPCHTTACRPGGLRAASCQCA